MSLNPLRNAPAQRRPRDAARDLLHRRGDDDPLHPHRALADPLPAARRPRAPHRPSALRRAADGDRDRLPAQPARPPRALGRRRSIGGIGFGFFIDELGKFITADNNYFFKPAAGLIYLIFVGLFLGSRAYQRRRGLNEDERVRNAIELIGEASMGPLQAEPRPRPGAARRGRGRATRCASRCWRWPASSTTTPDPDPPWYQRSADRIAAPLRRLDRAAAGSTRIVISVFVVWALASIVAILGLVFSVGFSDGAGPPRLRERLLRST